MTDLSSPPDLNFLTCGHVDDGKSTLMGRLLHDIGVVPDDQVRGATVDGVIDFSRLTDGLEDERAQGITIDVAYRFFRYRNRFYRIADTPGHVQYTRNMAVAAANSDAALVLVDAAHGVREQTLRHSRIAALFGIKTFAVVVNKMDLVGWDEKQFLAIKKNWLDAFGSGADKLNISFIPVSALLGDNVASASANTPWYAGVSLLEWIAQTIPADKPQLGFRVPVQSVVRISDTQRGAQGKLEGGNIAVGDHIGVACTSPGITVTVTDIYQGGRKVTAASAGQAVTIVPDTDVDLSRGTVLYGLNAPLTLADAFSARLLWLAHDLEGKERVSGIIKIHNREDQAEVEVVSSLDTTLCEATVRTATALPVDTFVNHPDTGIFIIIEPEVERVMAVGVVTSLKPFKPMPRRQEVSV